MTVVEVVESAKKWDMFRNEAGRVARWDGFVLVWLLSDRPVIVRREYLYGWEKTEVA